MINFKHPASITFSATLVVTISFLALFLISGLNLFYNHGKYGMIDSICSIQKIIRSTSVPLKIGVPSETANINVSNIHLTTFVYPLTCLYEPNNFTITINYTQNSSNFNIPFNNSDIPYINSGIPSNSLSPISANRSCWFMDHEPNSLTFDKPCLPVIWISRRLLWNLSLGALIIAFISHFFILIPAVTYNLAKAESAECSKHKWKPINNLY